MTQEQTFCTYSSIKPIATVTAGCFLEKFPSITFHIHSMAPAKVCLYDLIKARLGFPLHTKYTFNEKQMKLEVMSGSLPVNEQIIIDAHVFRQRH